MGLLAVIQGSDIITAVIGLIVLGLVWGLLVWLVNEIGVPEPIHKIVKAVLAIALVLILINFLMSLIGKPFINW